MRQFNDIWNEKMKTKNENQHNEAGIEWLKFKWNDKKRTRIVSWFLIATPSSLAAGQYSVGTLRIVASLRYAAEVRQRFLNKTD